MVKIENFGGITGLTVKLVYKGDKEAPFNSSNWYRHIITLTYNKKSIRFDFWASIAEPEITTKKQLIGAIECILLDGITGKEYQYYSIDDGTQAIMDEFGYSDFKEAKRVFKGVVKTYEKLEKLFGYNTSQTVYNIISIIEILCL